MVQGDGHFPFVQVGAHEEAESVAADNGLSGGGPLNRIEQRLGGEAHLREQEPTLQGEVLERRKVKHGPIVCESPDNSRGQGQRGGVMVPPRNSSQGGQIVFQGWLAGM